MRRTNSAHRLNSKEAIPIDCDTQNITDTVGKANAAALETAKVLTAINTRVAAKLAKQHLHLMGQALNGGVRPLKLLSTTMVPAFC